ncbi:MAG: PhnD/SsuA/transferrin family substrate-binding protein [Burkholderiales bacterium]|nr:PhnD/SsuA/transferrin family substrate-binding protein [Burkholderiales bacterium]
MNRNVVAFPLTALVATSLLAQPPQPAQPQPARPTLAVAFPKAVNRVETSKLYGRFLVHLGECARVNLVNQRGESVDSYFNGLDLLSEDEMLDGLKGRKLDMVQLSSGIVPVAVEASEAIPFAVRGNSRTRQIGAYKLHLIVRADSPYRKPADLKGKKIAHTTAASNSGNLAPRAYFPGIGLVPEKDYAVVYSNGHERSIAGVMNGFWDAGAVASDQFDRMVAKSEIRASAFRTLWESAPFPASAFVFGPQVPKALQERVSRCTYQYRFPAETQRLLDGSDAFLPVDYEKQYAPVKFVLHSARAAGSLK